MATDLTSQMIPQGLLADLRGARQAVLPLRGEIGEAEVEQLAHRLLALAAQGRSCLVLDLRRVTHWDYRHLPALWRLAQKLRARGGDLRLAAPTPYLAKILEFAGLSELLATDADPGRASRRFGGGSVRGKRVARRGHPA